MNRYEYGRIQKLYDSLQQQGVAPEIIDEIMQGGEDIRKNTSPKEKGLWLLAAMQKLERLLPPAVITPVREGCACCLGGERLKLSKVAFKAGSTLAERIAALDAAKMVCGNSARQVADNVFEVRFQPEGWPIYRCVCLPKVEGTPTTTYCQCCGGHIKHHMQVALGVPLTCEVVHTALTSYGKEACRFRFTIAE